MSVEKSAIVFLLCCFKQSLYWQEGGPVNHSAVAEEILHS